jgi:hypothetical protein
MKKVFIFIVIMMLFCTARAANEIGFPYSSAEDPNIYCVISNTDGKVWDVVNTAWVTWADANEPNYALDLSFSHKDFYKISFPAGITDAGTYSLVIYKWEGAEPNITDDLMVGADEFAWDGSAEITDYTAYTDRTAIVGDTNELQEELADGGRTDLLIDAIKAKTDNLPADPASETNVNANENKIDIIDTVVDAVLVDSAELQGLISDSKIAAQVKGIDTDTITAAALNADAVTEFWTKPLSDLAAGAPSATPSALTAINWLYESWRNKTTTNKDDSEIAIYKDNGSTKLCEAPISDDGTTFTKDKFEAAD